MDNKPSAVVVTYGELQAPNVRTVTVLSPEQAQELARTFCNVIPDDPAYYLDLINAWTGTVPLVFTHQDDDCFYFSACPVHGAFLDTDTSHDPLPSQFPEFYAYVAENSAT